MSDLADSSAEAPRLIPDDAQLLRRIHPDYVVEDKNSGLPRPSSAAFKDPNMSVDIEDFLLDDGLDATFSLAGYPGYSLVRIVAGAAREKNLSVVHVPLVENSYHAEVRGKKTGAIANHLKSAAQWAHLER